MILKAITRTRTLKGGGFGLTMVLLLIGERERERRNDDPGKINVIAMPVRPTLGIMSTRHNINGTLLIKHLNLIGTWFNEDQRTNMFNKCG